jgi:hypothetical protein
MQDPQTQPEYAITRHVLERMTFYRRQRLERDMEEVLGEFSANTFTAGVDYDILYDDIILRFEAEVLSERLADDYYEETAYYATPRTWWDMFKETYANRWWFNWYSKRWGAPHFDQHSVTVKVKVERFLKYPHADITPDPRLGRAIPYERLERVYD